MARHSSEHPASGHAQAPRRKRTRPPSLRRSKLGLRDVVAEGLSNRVLQDLYHHFMTVSWPRLFVTIAAFFLVFDLLFGCLYYLVPGCVANLSPPGFPGAFFFSVETLATVGYGDMHPQTLYGHLVAMVEIFVGLMMLALITGIMFARFSRPRARFLFANVGVVRPIDGKLTLMFRAANARQNVVQEASAKLRMLRDEVTPEGYRIRRIVDLPLVRSQHPVFSLGWTLMHVVDEASPLRLESPESLALAQTIFILSLSGTDETTGQVLMARAEYRGESLRWNHSFQDVADVRPDGTLHIDYSKFDLVEPLRAAGEERAPGP
ncbi:MAG TPA: ion channel [Steroidobacteraceae bacterium]|nr:ion channel [Steroidobacteraceae bacterium]